MTELQEAFLSELQSKAKFTTAEYAELYNKHKDIAIQAQKSNGASEFEAKSMGDYYTVTVLSDFIHNENKLSRIIAFAETGKKA